MWSQERRSGSGVGVAVLVGVGVTVGDGVGVAVCVAVGVGAGEASLSRCEPRANPAANAMTAAPAASQTGMLTAALRMVV
jgi:hypothetical protein